MNRTLRRPLLALGFASGLSILSASGCVDNNSTLFIQGIIATKPPECGYSNDPGGNFFGSGALDVAFRTSYTAGLLVGNQYTARGDKENLRTETTRVSLRGAEVHLSDARGNDIVEFSVYGSGFANPNRGADPGYGVFIAELIPESVGLTLKDTIGTDRLSVTQVIASVRVFGETTGGQDIESGEITYPINVCYGCLVNFPTEAIDLDTKQCTEGADEAPDTSSCYPGQDGYIDCRACVGTYPEVCRSPPPTP